jgi:hypothetical protein
VPLLVCGIHKNAMLSLLASFLRKKEVWCKGAWLALFIPWLVVVPTPALYFHKKG